MDQNLVVTSACSTEAEVLRLAHEIIPGIRSVYRWQGKVEEASECLPLMKTNSAKIELLRRAVELLHPYAVPEFLALPVASGSAKHVAWMNGVLNA